MRGRRAVAGACARGWVWNRTPRPRIGAVNCGRAGVSRVAERPLHARLDADNRRPGGHTCTGWGSRSPAWRRGQVPPPGQHSQTTSAGDHASGGRGARTRTARDHGQDDGGQDAQRQPQGPAVPDTRRDQQQPARAVRQAGCGGLACGRCGQPRAGRWRSGRRMPPTVPTGCAALRRRRRRRRRRPGSRRRAGRGGWRRRSPARRRGPARRSGPGRAGRPSAANGSGPGLMGGSPAPNASSSAAGDGGWPRARRLVLPGPG